MAAVPDEQAVSSFPNPPALFYKLYTDENVSKGIAPKPPPPVKGQYHMFGHPFDVSLSLLSSPFRDQPWAEWALKYLPFFLLLYLSCKIHFGVWKLQASGLFSSTIAACVSLIFLILQIEDAMVRPLEDLGIRRLYPQNYGQLHQSSLYIVSAFGLCIYPCMLSAVKVEVYPCHLSTYLFFWSLFLVDKKAELKKLNRSILICFLELLDILIGDPASPAVSTVMKQMYL